MNNAENVESMLNMSKYEYNNGIFLEIACRQLKPAPPFLLE